MIVDRPSSQVATSTAKPAQPVPTGPAIFRSDSELWPEELQPPRPLDPKSRTKLRRIFGVFGAKVRQCEEDLEETSALISAYEGDCDVQRELQQYASALRK